MKDSNVSEPIQGAQYTVEGRDSLVIRYMEFTTFSSGLRVYLFQDHEGDPQLLIQSELHWLSPLVSPTSGDSGAQAPGTLATTTSTTESCTHSNWTRSAGFATDYWNCSECGVARELVCSESKG